MKVLHIFKNDPDETVRELTTAFTDDETTSVPLYEDDVDWEGLVDEIFAADKVICWW